MALSFASAPPDVKKNRLMRRIRQSREPLGQLDRARVRAAGVARRVGQRLELLARGLGQLAAPVTEDDVPQSGEPVDVFLPVSIHEHRPVAAHPHVARPMSLRIVEGMNERGEVAFQEIGLHDPILLKVVS